MPGQVIFGRDELDLITELAACSLDESPGSNWVQAAGGLPDYICRVARGVKRSGKTTSQAIAIAVSRMKKWATGVGVNKDTQAKAVVALAQWEKLRAKSRTRTAAKTAGKVAMTATTREVLCLCSDVDYNVDIVRSAFDQRTRKLRRDWRAANPNASYEDGPASLWVKEHWSNFLIVQSDYGPDADLYQVPYTVDDKLEVTFGEAVEVKTQYVVVAEDDLVGAEMTDEILTKLLTVTAPIGAVAHLLALTPTPPLSGLDKIMAGIGTPTGG